MSKERNFEFRAWHKATKTMHMNIVPWQWDFVIDKMSHRCIESTGSGILGSGGNTMKVEVPAVRFDVLMQATNTYGKDKTLIYQDDVVKVFNDEIGSPIPPNYKGVVVFREGQWLVDNGKEAYPLWSEITEWEVLGNIHQNPNFNP
jgi:uncharacterized phage protein (TIGR01671 family)